MPVTIVVINDSSNRTIVGTNVFDRENGGVLVPPAGTSFPTDPPPVEGEWFWRTDLDVAYRYDGASWVAQAATAAAHGPNHENGGSDEINVNGLSGLLADPQTPDVHAIGGAAHSGQLDHSALSGINPYSHHGHANKAELDLVSDGDHDARSDNPHAVSKAQVGLGNVTNDAQLRRADNDWTGFTEEGSPGDTDLVLVEKVTTGAKRKVQLGNLPGGGGSVFGADYDYSESLSTSSTTSDDWSAVKVQHDTPTLTGTYRVGWVARVWQSGVADSVEVRLRNVTDNDDVSGPFVWEMEDITDRGLVSGFANIAFTGASKRFEIQWRQSRGGTAYIAQARFEIWRVS